MTVKQRQRTDRVLKAISTITKKIRKVNRPVGTWLQDRVYDLWDVSYR